MKSLLFPLMTSLFLVFSCGGSVYIEDAEDSENNNSTQDNIPIFPSEDPEYDCEISIDCTSFVSTDYVGNGVQWDPYEIYAISDSDWQKLYARLDVMQPQFIRMMHNISGKSVHGILIKEEGLEHLMHLLDYCQSRNITVMFGDWGGSLVDSEAKTINEPLLRNSAEYLDFLINYKGYDCIKYYNLVNEPNGNWSQTNGDYWLWNKAVRFVWDEIKKLGLDAKIKMAAPDVAIWTPNETNWVKNTARDLSDATGIYDIHTYPSKITVNSGEYTDIIKAYKDVVPTDAKIVMGEIGFKYIEAEDAPYQEENLRRAEALPHASIEDSQMFVYDYMYGTDMADALFQTINAGYSGCVAWMLDDAMHFKEPGKLKIWGFWNIFGDERFGSEHEIVRPWFYAWSLLCRYLPQGSDFYTVDVSGLDGVKAIASVYNGKRTLALVNVSKEKRTVKITADDFPNMENTWKYVYGEGLFTISGDCHMNPAATAFTFSPAAGEILEIAPESLILLTELADSQNNQY